MTETYSKSKRIILFLLVLLLISAVFFYYGRAKAGFFIDEIHTYGLSNSHYAPYITDAAGGTLIDTVVTNECLTDYATADGSEILDFGSVYYNQTRDVHPPLYYFLFNAVSGIAGESFSKWTGLLLNYVIYLAGLCVLYFTAMELCGSFRASLCTVVLYGLSTIGLSTALFIRMYTLLMLFTVLLAYLALRLLKTEKYKYCTFIGFTIFFGTFTQYYFVFYAFFLCAALCIYFLVRKNCSLLWRFALCSVLGIALTVDLFPACISHIFGGNGKVVGGSAIMDSLTDFASYPSRINSFVHFITHGLKAPIIIGAAALACLAVLILISRRNGTDGPKGKCAPLLNMLIIVVPAVLAWVLNIAVAPEKAVEERYVYNIAPIFVLAVGWLLAVLDFRFDLAVCAAVSLVITMTASPSNLTPAALEYNEILSSRTDDPVVYMTDNRFEPLTYDFQQLLLFDEVFTTDDPDSGAMLDYINTFDSNEIIVYIDEDEFWSSGYDPDVILPALEESTGYRLVGQLYTNGFSGAYLLRKD